MFITREVAKLILELDALNKVCQSERTRLIGSLREQFEEQRRIICSSPDEAGGRDEALREMDEFLAGWNDDDQPDS